MNCNKIITDKNCNTIIQDEPFDTEHVFIYILQLNKSDDNIYSQTFIRESFDQDIVFNIGSDGYYTLCRLIVTKDESAPYYYKNGKFYKGIYEISLQDLIAINPEVSKINITYYYYFQLCRLRQCFVDAAQKVIDERTSIKCDSVGVNKEDIYKRDLLWSSLNIIKYLVESDQYEEAERLLERISGCNGLCDIQNQKCGCGCGR